MKFSDNYGFSLPNKADNDPADIDLLSENFRLIDEILKKHEGFLGNNAKVLDENEVTLETLPSEIPAGVTYCFVNKSNFVDNVWQVGLLVNYNSNRETDAYRIFQVWYGQLESSPMQRKSQLSSGSLVWGEFEKYVTNSDLTTEVEAALTEAKESGDFKGEKGDSYVLTAEDKQEIVDDVVAEVPLVKTAEQLTFVDSIDEMTDTTKLYVLQNGFIYAYGKKSIIKEAENLFKADEAVLNAVMGSSSTSTLDGYVWSGLIPIDLTKASPFVVRVEGTQIATDTSTKQKMWLCDSNGKKLSAALLYPWRESVQIPSNYTNVEDDGTFYADYKSGAKVSDSIIANTKYIRVGFAMNAGTAVTVNDLANVSITFDVDNVNETVEGWFSTGLAFNQPADYSTEVAQLKNEVNALNKKIIELENASADNNTSLNKNTCSIFRKVVCCGDSLTAGYINIGNGVSATNEDYAWPHYMSLLTGNEYINCGDSGADVWTWQTRERGLIKARASGVAQAYLVGLGVNDASLVELGTIADIGTENETYYGGMSKIIRELNAISPKAKIFVQTMPSTTASFEPYSQAIREIVEAYKDTYPVHCLDLANYLSLYQTDSILGDSIGGHRTAIGYQQFAENLRYIWSEYINENISDFQDVYSLPYD